jgi:hypothetical protein
LVNDRSRIAKRFQVLQRVAVIVARGGWPVLLAFALVIAYFVILAQT